MKTMAIVKKEIDVAFVDIRVPVNYGDEDMPSDFPGREGDIWSARIDLDTGIIQGWPQGKTGSFDMKVVDEGTYILVDRSGEVVAQLIGEYVPNQLIPGEYGDYINLAIDAAGKVTNWLNNPSFDDFSTDDWLA